MSKTADMIDASNLEHLRLRPATRTFNPPVSVFHFPNRTTDELQHDHDFVEIQICAGGEGWQRCKKGDISFRRGKVLIILPGAWHYHHDNKSVDAYVCCFGAEILKRELLWTLDDPALNSLLWKGGNEANHGVVELDLNENTLSQCIGFLDALEGIKSRNSSPSPSSLLGYLTLVLSSLSESHVEAKPASEISSHPPVHSAVKRCVALIEENVAEEWSTKDFAKKLNIDPSYLGRLFQIAMGLSPLAYLNQVRAQQAARMLLRTHKSIAEIGIAVGWPDPNYFARKFKANFGISATQYRNRYIQHQMNTGEQIGLTVFE
ncbi:helix-turn-helix domain-containing protein [Puniceicoccus vermicola]|uniref:Helix-turn-helix transcriptional regulator n=1 Tax=Puniceicoccus vermicola TaxID=388746 RepID=A0A7X1AZC8_9BACT|nr:AraC family transcriptional regulator [Puniceicoccus vermicola]MBC2602753.1 helix-turn-helix transcriptional regulator [Puniceicoccus vermicola]